MASESFPTRICPAAVLRGNGQGCHHCHALSSWMRLKLQAPASDVPRLESEPYMERDGSTMEQPKRRGDDTLTVNRWTASRKVLSRSGLADQDDGCPVIALVAEGRRTLHMPVEVACWASQRYWGTETADNSIVSILGYRRLFMGTCPIGYRGLRISGSASELSCTSRMPLQASLGT